MLGFGQRLANSCRDRHYPNRRLDAASLVYTKAPQIIRAFDDGDPVKWVSPSLTWPLGLGLDRWWQ